MGKGFRGSTIKSWFQYARLRAQSLAARAAVGGERRHVFRRLAGINEFGDRFSN